jgi:virulence-associated protein VagC
MPESAAFSMALPGIAASSHGRVRRAEGVLRSIPTWYILIYIRRCDSVSHTKTVPSRAKLFRTGRSQAVRLPKEFRFAGDEVNIRREGDVVILEPIERNAWPRGYWQRLAEVKVDYEVAPMRLSLEEVDVDRR